MPNVLIKIGNSQVKFFDKTFCKRERKKKF